MNLSALLRNRAFVVAMTVLLLTGLGMSAGIKAMGIYLRKLPINAPDGRLLLSLPTETEHWIREGSDRIEDAETEKVLGTQNYVSRNYVLKKPADDKQKVVLDFHAAYYTGMIDTVPHVPERCFVAHGLEANLNGQIVHVPLDQSRWTMDSFAPEGQDGEIFRVRLDRFSDKPGSMVRLPRKPGEIKMRVSTYTTPKGQKLTAGYFFVANGGSVPNAEDVRLLAFDLKADYAYYLKVQFTSGGGETPEELAQLAASLLDDLFGEIMRCVPDWVEVEKGEYPIDNPRKKKAGAT